jgi:hypothetical protein
LKLDDQISLTEEKSPGLKLEEFLVLVLNWLTSHQVKNKIK